MSKGRKVLLTTLTVIVLAAVECSLAVAFGRREVELVAANNRPTVTFTRPADRELNVLPNIFISCDVFLPNTGGVSNGSLFNGALKFFRTRDKTPVPFHFNTSVCRRFDRRHAG